MTCDKDCFDFPFRSLSAEEWNNVIMWDQVLERFNINDAALVEKLQEDNFRRIVYPFYELPFEKNFEKLLFWVEEIESYDRFFPAESSKNPDVKGAGRQESKSRRRGGRRRDRDYDTCKRICLPKLKKNPNLAALQLYDDKRIKAIRDKRSPSDPFPDPRTWQRWIREWKKEIRDDN